MAYECRILADSVGAENPGSRLTTFEVTFPRFVLAEFNTHRVFSRNSASSRAIPVAKLIEKVQTDPALPVWWGRYQRGMSAQQELNSDEIVEAKGLWLQQRDTAVATAQRLMDISGPQQGLHKQITNRLLEPWMWQTVLVTATEWSNFYALRISEFAQPEIKKIAEMMQVAQAQSTPTVLAPGEWHLPLIREEDRAEAETHPDSRLLLKLSTARCARVSYLTHDGVRDIEADLRLHDTLVSSGHMSPCEHPARPMTFDESLDGSYASNFDGWVQYRKLLPNEADYSAWARSEIMV